MTDLNENQATESVIASEERCSIQSDLTSKTNLESDSDEQSQSSHSESSNGSFSSDLAQFLHSARNILISKSVDKQQDEDFSDSSRVHNQCNFELTEVSQSEVCHLQSDEADVPEQELVDKQIVDDEGNELNDNVLTKFGNLDLKRPDSDSHRDGPSSTAQFSTTNQGERASVESHGSCAAAQDPSDGLAEQDPQRPVINPLDSLFDSSPKGSQSVAPSLKKGKIALPFFKYKPNVQFSTKQMPMKALQRMIRAGKPSFEQIHSWRHSFETLLNDRFGLALFKDFLSTEFSDENIEFWIACQEYKTINNPKKLAIKAQKIFDEFIAVQSNREVNLDSKTRLQTEADLANPTIHTLDNAQKRIQALMEKDSYRRFLRSDVYLTLYSEAKEVAKAAAASALAASLQEASSELDGAVLNLIASSTSPFSFGFRSASHLSGALPSSGLHLPGVAAAAASAEAGMNSVQDLQLLGLSTSRHMRNSRSPNRTNTQVSTPKQTSPTVPKSDSLADSQLNKTIND